MLTAVGSLTVLGITLGTLLGIAAKYLAVQGDALEAELEGLLPGSNCGQCGFAGCKAAAAALAAGNAQVTLCPPGGRAVAATLAAKMGHAFDAGGTAEAEPLVAFVHEGRCIGCSRCIQKCSSDGIVGAPKQIHTVLSDACHGCGKCVSECPTEGIEMMPIPVTLATWHWHKPAPQAIDTRAKAEA
ncbi:MAG: RnfABCDGE type electron transport complex subunit B [Azospirillum sp.]|nr:RnfABCDGE type electron transport complex subunit B [Azospirillum sp.]